jgi:two-component sensor histidine kinase
MLVRDVYITEELARRPAKAADHLEEKRALQDLAARMVDQPEEMLPRFVDLAMKMTDGVSAGLSLLEPEPAPGVFRWRHVRGILSQFEDATTPRQFSPCGITLDENAPVLSRHPELVYDWIAKANIVVPEVLLVPLFRGEAEPFGTLWIVSDSEGHFDSGHARLATELASFVSIALRMLETTQRLQRALDEQEILAKEMSHRLKNVFALTDGLIRLTARSVSTKGELAETLSGRLHALARAHALVRRNFSNVAIEARSSDLVSLIGMIVEPHQTHASGAPSRFTIDGPAIPCGEHATNAMALAFHELATNAAKYGALASDVGHVEIVCRTDDETLTVTWTEKGGRNIAAAPAAEGFGSQMMKNALIGQFGGTIDREWRGEGLVVTISAPLASLAN